MVENILLGIGKALELLAIVFMFIGALFLFGEVSDRNLISSHVTFTVAFLSLIVGMILVSENVFEGITEIRGNIISEISFGIVSLVGLVFIVYVSLSIASERR